MDKDSLYISILKKYCKQIVHLRQQYHLATSSLGIVLGAGVSIDIGLPSWKQLVNLIAQTDEISKLGIVIDSNRDPVSNAQLLFQAYKSDMLEKCSEEDIAYNKIEMKIRAQWQKIVHNALYKNIEPSITSLVPTNHYLWSLVEIIKKTPMTINYNFDDTIQRLLSASRKSAAEKENRGYTTLWNSNVFMYPKNSVIYHPNGFLPYTLSEHPSERLVFLEDSFADQLIDSIHGHYNVLTDYFNHNTCLLIGLSLSDPTLKHILRTNATNFPGIYHYYVKHIKDGCVPVNEKAFADANFDVYNLITLYLTSEEIAGLLDLIQMPETEFHDFVDQAGNLYKTYKYILVGSVAVGKSTAISFFRNISTQDEWLDPMPEKMAKDPSKVDSVSIESIDEWIAKQWGKKNYKMLCLSSGIHLIDRGPLDAFAFTPKGEWVNKAQLTIKAISPRNAKRMLCPAEIIFLVGDPCTMASRAILSQKDTDSEKLELQQNLIKYIYSNAKTGVRVIDTRNKGKAQVVKEVATIIFREDYCEAQLNSILEGILNNQIPEPDDLL